MKEQNIIELSNEDNVSQEGKRKRMNAEKTSEDIQDYPREGDSERGISVKPESEGKKEQKTSQFVHLLVEARTVVYNAFCSNNRGTKIFWLVVLNMIFLGILLASIVSAVRHKEREIDWCNGVGFMWLLFGSFYYGVLYYMVKYLLVYRIHRHLRPVVEFFDKIKDNKYFRISCYCIPPILMGIYVILSPGKSGRRMFSYFGIFVFLFLGFLISKYPGQIKWRPVVSGVVLQFIFGWLTIRNDIGKNVLQCMGNKLTQFLKYTDVGSEFVYGFLAHSTEENAPLFAFSVLPVIFFLSFVLGMLSYLGILHFFVLKVAWIMKILMGTTVCESVNAAASIFLSMTEAPLLIKNYLNDLTKSELCAVLCSGWATVAGAVMAAYIRFGVKASYLISASLMSAPASLSISKLLYPETEESKTTLETINLHRDEAKNFLDAGTKGVLTAVAIVSTIAANLIAFLGFVGFLDGTLQWIGRSIDYDTLSIHLLLTKLFYPISFLMGVEEDSLEDVAYLIGIKTVANEFQAYRLLGDLVKQNKLSERTEIITTFALCGFSNFGSIGISVATMTSIAPEKVSTITEVAFIAFIAANMVCFLTACVAGCFID